VFDSYETLMQNGLTGAADAYLGILDQITALQETTDIDKRNSAFAILKKSQLGTKEGVAGAAKEIEALGGVYADIANGFTKISNDMLSNIPLSI